MPDFTRCFSRLYCAIFTNITEYCINFFQIARNSQKQAPAAEAGARSILSDFPCLLFASASGLNFRGGFCCEFRIFFRLSQAFMSSCSRSIGITPTLLFTAFPPLKRIRVGIELTPNSSASSGSSSTFTLPTFTSVRFSAA